MTDDQSKPVANAYEAEGFAFSPSRAAKAQGLAPPAPELDEKFSARMAPLADAIGLKRLGVTAMTVEPGKRAFPFHNHHANDELFVILEGEGTYRFGETDYPIKPGDLCGAPHGGPETAHQIINTGATTLRYLSISTRIYPEVAEYPDSGKFGVYSIRDEAGPEQPMIRHIGRVAQNLDYWDGEGG